MSVRRGTGVWAGISVVALSLSLMALSGCATASAESILHSDESQIADSATSTSVLTDRGSASNAFLSTSTDGAVSAASSARETASGWNDGTYYATGKGGKFGGVPVMVIIKQGTITSITLGANSETEAMCEKARSVVVPQILEDQSTEDIDVATGATYTSNAIIDGVNQALERASK